MSASQNQPPIKKNASHKPEQSSTAEASESTLAALLATLTPLIAPLLEFHKQVEGTLAEDVRLFWDVRLLKGEGSMLMQTSGTTTLPGLLNGSAIRDAPGNIYREIEEKIAKPLSQRLQDSIGDGMEAHLAAIATRGLPPVKDDGGMAEAVDREMARDASALRFADPEA